VTTSTWPDLQETSVQYDRQNPGAVNERPHTISSGKFLTLYTENLYINLSAYNFDT
jgi:hypothetical protein